MSDELDTQRTITTEQQSAIDAILAAKQERGLTIIRDIEGVAIEMHFQPTMSIPALRIVSKVQNLAKRQDDVMAQLEALVEFMDAMAFPSTANLIAEMLRVGAIDINDVAEIQQEVVAAVAARPTGRSLSSDDGSTSNGVTSMVGAESEALTHPI